MRIIALCVSLFFLLTQAAFAQSGGADDRDRVIAEATETLLEAEAAFNRGEVEGGELEEKLRALLSDARSRLPGVEADLASARDRLSLLGPPPAEDAAPEEPEIARRREALRVEVARLETQLSRVNANIDGASSLLTTMSSSRLASLYRGLLTRGEPLLSPTLWRNAATEMTATFAASGEYLSAWASGRREAGRLAISLAALAGALLVSLLMFGPVHRWLHETFARWSVDAEPTAPRQVALAGLKMIARVAPGLLGGFAFLETARATGLIAPGGEALVAAIWVGLLAFLIVEGFTTGLFAPKDPRWALAPTDADRGRRISNLVLWIVVIFGGSRILIEIARAAGDAPSGVLAERGFTAVVIAGLFYVLCSRSTWMSRDHAVEPTDEFERETDNGDGAAGGAAPEKSDSWRIFRRLGRALAIAIALAAVVGYIPLADFAASRIYWLAILLAVAWFLRSSLREFAFGIERHVTAQRSRLTDEDHSVVRFWIGASIDLVFAIALIPAVLVLAGMRWQAVRDAAFQAFFGFRIGAVTISLADIFGAIAVFLAILGATRLIQRGLEKGAFVHSRIDPGVQNSLTTLIGYAGLLVALLVGVTTLGFDLSNLAIIAGALSVGIGFGLQSIVNNFVSGLILLFERPIKAGDWIVTGSGEGIVKRISVRSTEIETWDRSSIIVPNSELISSSVTNWTHKSKLGRVIVPIGVAYGSDPEEVREILLKVGREHPQVVRYPEPFVVWRDFGASSLDFELRAYVRDINSGLGVKTDLRFAIFKAFREAGLEIPYPQQDVYIRSWPGEAATAAARPKKAHETEAPAPPARERDDEDDDDA